MSLARDQAILKRTIRLCDHRGRRAGSHASADLLGIAVCAGQQQDLVRATGSKRMHSHRAHTCIHAASDREACHWVTCANDQQAIVRLIVLRLRRGRPRERQRVGRGRVKLEARGRRDVRRDRERQWDCSS